MASIEADLREGNANDGEAKKHRERSKKGSGGSKRRTGTASRKTSGQWSSSSSSSSTGPSSSSGGPSSSTGQRSLKGSLRRKYRTEISREEADNVAALVIQAWWRMVTARRLFLLSKQSHKFRTRIVQEIVDTERTYLAILQALVNNFDNPLASHSEIASVDERKTIFGGLAVILGFSQELYENLFSRFRDWELGSQIGDIFLKVTPFFRAYSVYVQNYGAAISLVTKLAARPEWAAFEKEALKTSKMARATLPSLLITPVQRVPRYLLLLRDLLKHTDPTHPDFQALKTAHDKIEETAAHINNQAKAAEKLAKVAEIELTVEALPFTLLEAGRRFILEGMLFIVENEGEQKTTLVHAYLFSDMILCCSQRQQLGKRAFIKTITLHDSSVDRQDDVTFSLIRDEGKADGHVTETILIAPDAIARQDWIKSISTCIQTLRQQKEKIMEYKFNVASSRAEQAKALISARYATGSIARTSRRSTVTQAPAVANVFPVAAMGISGHTVLEGSSSSSIPTSSIPSSSSSIPTSSSSSSSSPSGKKAKKGKKVSRPGSGATSSLRKWSASLTQSEAKQWRKMDPLEKRDATNRAMEDLKQLEAQKLEAQRESLERANEGKQTLRTTLTQKTGTGKISYKESRASLRRAPKPAGSPSSSDLSTSQN